MASRPERILVVDDQSSVVQLCRRMLESQGFETAGAFSGEEALELIKQRHFDLVIIDIVLPGIDGVEAFREAKKIHEDLVGIVITGHATKGAVVDAMKSGLYGFIEKPFTVRELKTTVEDVLSRHRVEKENVRLKALIPLFEITKAITSERELDHLYNLVLTTALAEARAELGSLMHLNENSKELEIVAAKGLPPEVIKSVRQKVGEGIAGRVAQTKQPLIITDGRVDDPALTALLRHQGNLSALSFPLVYEGNVVGVLNLNRHSTVRTFTESDEELLAILCGQAASAIVSARLNENLRRSYLSTISVLSKAIMARDPYTQDHSDNVALISVRVAERVGLPAEEIEAIRFAGILHDIGKIGISESILLKPGKLTEEEYEQMKKHPEIGAQILESAEFPWKIIPIVLHHQERYDGTGYPAGLKGEEIPIGARILSVCDTYQALISDRAYRKGLPKEKAVEILREVSGTQLDGKIVEVFLDVSESVDGKGTVVQRSLLS